MSKKRLLLVFIAIIAMFLLAGCAPHTNLEVDVPDADGKSAVFWGGLWHGIISPITFVWSLFSDTVNIYEVHNSGGWYDFGFLLGASLIFGGMGRGAKRKYR